MSKTFDITSFSKGKNYAIQASAGTGKTHKIVEMVGRLLDDGVDMDKLLIVTYTEKAAGELRDRVREKTRGINCDIDSASICTIHSFCQSILDEFCISAGTVSGQELIDESAVDDFISRYVRSGTIFDKICKIKEHSQDTKIEDELIRRITALVKSYYLNKEYKPDAAIVSLKTQVGKFADVYEYWALLEGCCLDGKTPYDASPSVKKDIDLLSSSTDTNMSSLAAFLKESKDLVFAAGDYATTRNTTEDEKAARKRLMNLKTPLKHLSELKDISVALALMYGPDLYEKWQEEKAKYKWQTFNDMLRTVREEVMSGGPLLEKIREKYTYVIIDEFQDTNQKQWDIFKKVFLEDKDHNIIVVGDPKQSIYKFQGAQIGVYEKAVEEIIAAGGEEGMLVENYRATKDVIDSTNAFFSNTEALDEFSNSECGNRNFKVTYEGNPVKAFWICDTAPGTSAEAQPETQADQSQPAKSNEEIYADVICQTIVDCCSIIEDEKTKLRVTDKDGIERNVSFSDFAILAKSRSEMDGVTRALEKSGIPYAKYQDRGLFSGTECAHWVAILEAIDTADFTGRNRIKFRRALYTVFFDKDIQEIRDSGYDRDDTPEIMLFDNWRKLANERHWEELIDAIIGDSAIEERMKSLRDLKSLGVIRQIGDYAVEYLSAKDNLTLLVKNLRGRLKNADPEGGEDGDNIVTKSTDFDCVKIMTIHASKGLEYPIVISMAGLNGYKDAEDIYGYFEDAEDKKGSGTPGSKASGRNVLSFMRDTKRCDKEREDETKRLIYVAYTRAKYVLILPRNFKPKKKMGFVMSSIDTFCESGNYRKLEDNGKSYKEIKSEVKKILRRKRTTETFTEEQQRVVLGGIIRQQPGLSSYKHAYSSMSHPKTKDDVMSDTDIMRNDSEDTLEADAGSGLAGGLESGSEEQKAYGASRAAAVTGLEKYDRNAMQVKSAYDEETAPIQLSEKYPAGAGIGNALHEVLELMDYSADPSSAEVEELIVNSFKRQGIKRDPDWIKDTADMLKNVLSAHLPVIHGSIADGIEVQSAQDGDLEEDKASAGGASAALGSFTLSSISADDRKNEVEFNFNKENEQLKNYFNGFIDLIIRRGEYYSILDWKSDRLSEEFTSYCAPSVLKDHVNKLYSIQRVLYAYTLIKWLGQFYPELSRQEIFEKHFGGIYYVFVRGCNEGTGNGIYAQTWEDYAALEAAYNEIVKDKVPAAG